MTRYDDNTEYCIEESDVGFTLYVWYETGRFFRSTTGIEPVAKQKLYNIAHHVADERKKEIEPINDQRIESNYGRTFWAVASWSAKVKVSYKKGGRGE